MHNGAEKTDFARLSRPKPGFTWRAPAQFALTRRSQPGLKSTPKQAAPPAPGDPELFQTLLDVMPDAVIAVDHGGTITLTNARADAMFGYAPGALQGQKANRLFALSDVNAQRTRGALSGLPHATLKANRSDGDLFPIEITANSAVHNGQPVVLIVAHDISDRETMTAQLRRSQRLTALGALSSGVAHDFNNIMSVIKINLAICRERAAQDASMLAYIERCLYAAKLSDGMITRLLDFAGEHARKDNVVQPSKHVANAIALLRHSLGGNIEIIENYADDAWRCDIDAAQLENAVINLAINARDAMPDGGILTVRVGGVTLSDAKHAQAWGLVPGDYVSITVDDTGTGVSAETAARAFEPFFTTKSPGKGTGLGLSMISSFAHQHGGAVRLVNKPTSGAMAEILLPRR